MKMRTSSSANLKLAPSKRALTTPLLMLINSSKHLKKRRSKTQIKSYLERMVDRVTAKEEIVHTIEIEVAIINAAITSMEATIMGKIDLVTTNAVETIEIDVPVIMNRMITSKGMARMAKKASRGEIMEVAITNTKEVDVVAENATKIILTRVRLTLIPTIANFTAMILNFSLKFSPKRRHPLPLSCMPSQIAEEANQKKK